MLGELSRETHDLYRVPRDLYPCVTGTLFSATDSNEILVTEEMIW